MRPEPLRHRKTRDRAVILPVVGAALFLPPVAGVFRMEAAVAGVPLPVLYVFAVWAALIACAALLAPRLREAEAAAEDPPAETAADPAAGPGARG